MDISKISKRFFITTVCLPHPPHQSDVVKFFFHVFRFRVATDESINNKFGAKNFPFRLLRMREFHLRIAYDVCGWMALAVNWVINKCCRTGRSPFIILGKWNFSLHMFFLISFLRSMLSPRQVPFHTPACCVVSLIIYNMVGFKIGLHCLQVCMYVWIYLPIKNKIIITINNNKQQSPNKLLKWKSNKTKYKYT